MKRIYPALIFIFVCISLCLIANVSTQQHADNLIKILTVIEENVKKDNLSAALTEAHKLKSQWASSKILFNSFSQTKLTDEVNSSISVLENYIETKEISSLIIEINRCINYLKEIYKWQKLSIGNIL